MKRMKLRMYLTNETGESMMLPDIKERLCSAMGFEVPYRPVISFQLAPKDDQPVSSVTLVRGLQHLFEGTEYVFSAGYEEGNVIFFDLHSKGQRRYKGLIRNMTDTVFPLLDVLLIDTVDTPESLEKLLTAPQSLEDWRTYFLESVPRATLVEADSQNTFMIEFPYPDSRTRETMSVKYLDGNVAVLDKGHPNGTVSGTWRQIGCEVYRIMSDK